jgi:hypothetical protein
VCGVFSVNSDEEGSFENDSFSILYDPNQASDPIVVEDNNPVGFLDELISVPQLENNSTLDQVTTISNISTIMAALVAAPQPPALPSNRAQLRVSGQTINFDLSGGNDGYCISAPYTARRPA